MIVSDKKHFHILGDPWPLQSLDLTVQDLFLQGYLKECMHARAHMHTHTHSAEAAV